VLVNGEERHIYDNLNPGDVLEVVSSGPHKQPEPDWLNHCNPTLPVCCETFWQG